MKHTPGYFYLICKIGGFDWNVSPETSQKAGPYICPLCERIQKAREERKKFDEDRERTETEGAAKAGRPEP